jgi:single-stranded DNA-binding protein
MDYQHIAVFLIGNAANDAEVRQAKQRETFYGDFRLAVCNRAGETTYFPIRCFGKLAESVTAIKKGTRVFVQGELEISSFTAAEGNKQMTYRVTAETYRILGHRKHGSKGEV